MERTFRIGFCLSALLLWVRLPTSINSQDVQGTKSRPASIESSLDLKTVKLWDGEAPGALGNADSDSPKLTVFPPQTPLDNGTAVIIAPGGGYVGLAINLEGRQVADWFASRGITAFLLTYRLGPKYIYPIPLLDAQRAIRMVRYNASGYKISPDRIGMIGFSAGGHLAATAAVLSDDGDLHAADPIDRTSSRLNFLILGYPWLNAMQLGQTGVISYCSVIANIAAEKCKRFEREYTPALHVTKQTPPTFIYHTSADRVVPVDASITFYRALHAAGVPVEMHIFEHGAHGTGLGLGDPALDLWPVLLETWLRGEGLLNSKAAP